MKPIKTSAIWPYRKAWTDSYYYYLFLSWEETIPISDLMYWNFISNFCCFAFWDFKPDIILSIFLSEYFGIIYA